MVFITEYYDRLSLNDIQINQLKAVTKGASITGIRMQDIFRLVFRRFPIVSKRTDDFELYRPFARDNKVRLSSYYCG